MQNFSENNALVVGLAPDADRWAGTQTSDWVSAKHGRNIDAVVAEGTGTTGTTTLTMLAASDAAGAGAEAIPFRYRISPLAGPAGDWIQATVAGFLTAAGGDQIIDIEVLAEELPEGKPWVALNGVEGVDAPTDAAVLFIVSNLRYPQRIPDAPTL